MHRFGGRIIPFPLYGIWFGVSIVYCFSKSSFCPETALAITSRACRPVAGFQCWVPADRRHRRNGLPTVTAAGGNGELRHLLAPEFHRIEAIGAVFQKEAAVGFLLILLRHQCWNKPAAIWTFFLKLYRPSYIVFVVYDQPYPDIMEVV